MYQWSQEKLSKRYWSTNVLVLLLVVVLGVHWTPPSDVSAQNPDPDVFACKLIDQKVTLSIRPFEAFFLVTYQNVAVNRIPALALYGDERKEEPGQERDWFLAARVCYPKHLKEINLASVVYGEEGGYSYQPLSVRKFDMGPGEGGSVEELRAYLLEKKKELNQVQAVTRTNESALNKIRADADQIAGVSRIVDLRDEHAQIKADLANVEQDIAMLQKFLSMAQKETPPINFARREVELTRQLSELAAAAKNVETGELLRIDQAEDERESELMLIESTRNEDPEALRQELARLQKERRELEARQNGARRRD